MDAEFGEDRAGNWNKCCGTSAAMKKNHHAGFAQKWRRIAAIESVGNFEFRFHVDEKSSTSFDVQRFLSAVRIHQNCVSSLLAVMERRWELVTATGWWGWEQFVFPCSSLISYFSPRENKRTWVHLPHRARGALPSSFNFIKRQNLSWDLTSMRASEKNTEINIRTKL